MLLYFLFIVPILSYSLAIEKKPPACLQMKKQLARSVLLQLFCMCDQKPLKIPMKELNFQLNCRLEACNVARHGFFQRYFSMLLMRRTFSMAAPVNRILRVFGKDTIFKMQLSTYSKLELPTAV